MSLYEMVWKYHNLHVNWALSRLIAIRKGPTKGKIEDPEAYQGLQVGAFPCKIMVLSMSRSYRITSKDLDWGMEQRMAFTWRRKLSR